MFDKNELYADLQKIKQILDKQHNEKLAKWKSTCDKFNSNQFNDLVHELVSKEDMLELLSSTGIEVAQPVKKDILTKAVEKAVVELQSLLLENFIVPDTEDEEPNAEDNEVVELTSICTQRIEASESSEDIDPELLKYLEPEDYEKSSIQSKGIRENGILTVICKVANITNTYNGVETKFKAEFNVADFNQWVDENLFLVKACESDMAYLELGY